MRKTEFYNYNTNFDKKDKITKDKITPLIYFLIKTYNEKAKKTKKAKNSRENTSQNKIISLTQLYQLSYLYCCQTNDQNLKLQLNFELLENLIYSPTIEEWLNNLKNKANVPIEIEWNQLEARFKTKNGKSLEETINSEKTANSKISKEEIEMIENTVKKYFKYSPQQLSLIAAATYLIENNENNSLENKKQMIDKKQMIETLRKMYPSIELKKIKSLLRALPKSYQKALH